MCLFIIAVSREYKFYIKSDPQKHHSLFSEPLSASNSENPVNMLPCFKLKEEFLKNAGKLKKKTRKLKILEKSVKFVSLKKLEP